MPGKLLRSVLIGLLVGGLLLALMPSLRQWQLAPTTQNDTADDSPASYNAAVRRAAPAVVNVYNRALNSTSHNQLTLGSGVIMDQRGYILTNKHVINDADQIIAPCRTAASSKRCSGRIRFPHRSRRAQDQCYRRAAGDPDQSETHAAHRRRGAGDWQPL
ncbi:outer membrane stress sensor protease DegS [Klebsiella pneumoniae]|uniref:Outer membrane stress sensor protease DegS n=1 Tax=Klebsiella pneumoniae TaxID=573 RepID=A0A377U3C2_KLEPN|nr:outer membrane stress sensor protease DegS [Klebsiella pneumoniae]